MEKTIIFHEEYYSDFYDLANQANFSQILEQIDIKSLKGLIQDSRYLPSYDPVGFIQELDLMSCGQSDLFNFQELGLYIARLMCFVQLPAPKEVPCFNILNLELVTEAQAQLSIFKPNPDPRLDPFIEDLNRSLRLKLGQALVGTPPEFETGFKMYLLTLELLQKYA
jgi:hypothetical protein